LQPRDIVVIGGSAGSIDPLKTIVGDLPADFPASIFITIHVSADSPNMLARLLARLSLLPVTNPVDQEQIQRGHIYVARPDHHLTIEDGRIRVLRGPRENRHRPAIDPLLRTAAREYGPRVVGVVLSGLRDDGSAGLFAIKQRNGIAIVQDPRDAARKEMPRHAIEYAEPDYILAKTQIAPTLIELAGPKKASSSVKEKNSGMRKPNGKNGGRKSASAPTGVLQRADVNQHISYASEGEGAPSVFACPECHGVLWEMKSGKITQFRCRVGHSYGPESLATELSAASEAALWAAVRALEEKAAMQRRIAEGMTGGSVTARLLDQSEADTDNARLLRDMIFRRDAELEAKGHASEKAGTKTINAA
jgi:two-component system, chemotaxis family, protein-glutamate methylesterase/glutaminase